MRYRPEGMPSLLSNEQEAKFWLIGTGVVVVVGLVVYAFIKLLGFIF